MEGFLLVCVFILLVMIVLNRSKQKNERAEDRKIIRDLTTRIYFLEELLLSSSMNLVRPQEHVAEVKPVIRTTPAPKPRSVQLYRQQQNQSLSRKSRRGESSGDTDSVEGTCGCSSLPVKPVETPASCSAETDCST